MKKTGKILLVLCIVLAIVTLAVPSFASDIGIKPTDLTGKAPTATGTLTTFGNNIIGVIRTVGVIVAVAILLILGIKYMMGSAEEKADYKKSMIPYIVGAVLIFASTAIVGIVYDMASALNGTASGK